MLEFVLVRRGEVRAHAAVVARDNHSAAAGGLGGVDEVFYIEACGGAGRAEVRGCLVGADAANVDD